MFLFLFSSNLNIFQTIDADDCKEKKITFSLEKIWQSYKKDDCDDADEELRKDIQDYYDGCRKATWDFLGPSHDIADNVMKSLEVFITKLSFFANSNSTVLASSSHEILESIRKCNKLGISGFNIIKEYNKVGLAIAKDFKDIVTKLSDIIGQLADSFMDALSNLNCAFTNFMSKFLKSEGTGLKNKVNYEPILKQYQNLINTLAIIAEILLNKCELVGSYEAVTILTWIVQFFTIATQGINSCYQTVLYEQKSTVPQKVELGSAPLENVLLGVTRIVDSVSFPYTESTKAQLTNLVNITMSFNAQLQDIIGPFEGVTMKVGVITQNPSKNDNSSVEGVTKGLNET